jgi:hypothetical protein
MVDPAAADRPSGGGTNDDAGQDDRPPGGGGRPISENYACANFNTRSTDDAEQNFVGLVRWLRPRGHVYPRAQPLVL